MNILIISSSDPYELAGTVAYDLYKGLSDNNDVSLLVKFCYSKEKNIKSFLSAPQFYSTKVFHKIKRVFIKFKLVSGDVIQKNPDFHVQNLDQTITFYRTGKLLKKAAVKPDVIIVLFMQSFVSYKNLYELNQMTGAPVYLYPMDMAPFTGGCHYSWDCIGYQKQCGTCPAIYSQNFYDQTFINHKYKTEYMQKTDVRLFAGNSQIFQQISKSTIFQSKTLFENIYPVPDKSIFKSLLKDEVRDFFGINHDRMVLFFGSVSLSDRRKGMQILRKSLSIVFQQLSNQNYDTSKVLLLVAGSHHGNDDIYGGFSIKNLGLVSDYNLLAKAYNVADYFICPSVEDAGPTMILQSILCSTPTISFNIGFAIDFVADGINGFVANEKNEFDLASCIYKAITSDKKQYNSITQNLKSTSDQIDKNIVLKKIQSAINGNKK